MDRDLFQRPNRMVHRFGPEAERASIEGTFDMPHPMRPDQLSSRAVSMKTDGPSYVREGLSPVTTPGGKNATFGSPREIAGDMMGGGAGAQVTTVRRDGR
jgi:hypothetical protein